MPFAALLMLIAGAWLVDSAVQNRKPVQTLVRILQNPSGARQAVKDSRGTGYASVAADGKGIDDLRRLAH